MKRLGGMRVGMLLLAAAALPGIASRAGAAETVRIGTPAAEPYIFSLLNVGADAGIFQKHGIDLRRIDFAGGGKVGQGLTSGSIDMALSGSTDLVFIAKGLPAKAVANMLSAPVDMAIIARPDPGHPGVDRLKGKIIVVTTATSLTAWLAEDFARHEGWGPGGVKPAPIGAVSASVAALRTGNIDAFVGPTEAGYALEAKGEALPLVTFGYLHDFITHILYARDSLIAAHPETVRAVVAAWFDTVKFARAHKGETIRLSRRVTKASPAIAEKVYDEQTPALSSDGRFEQKALAAVAQSFVDLHLVATPPVLNELYTEKFLP
ncbi:MAG: ABC transporter substrate-binding protein [Stellaceae bacterium]